MIVYQWRHKPTGLFHKLPRNYHGTQTELNREDGEVLFTKRLHPVQHIVDGCIVIAVTSKQLDTYNLTEYRLNNISSQRYAKIPLDEWELVEYDLVERKKDE